MKIKRNHVMIIISVLIVSACFLGGYLLLNPAPSRLSGIEKNQPAKNEGEATPIYQPVESEFPEESLKPFESVYYLLQTENNKLNFYEVEGDVRRLIKSISINPDIFPKADRELLKKGIKTENLEAGFQIFEDFTS